MTDNNNFNPIKDGESIYLIDYVDQLKNELKVIKIKCNQNQIIPNNLKNTARYVSVIIDKDNAIKCEIIKDPRLTHIKKLCDIKVDTGKSVSSPGPLTAADNTPTTPIGYPIYGKSHVSKITPIIMAKTGGQRYDDELDEDELDEYYDEETTDEEEPDLDLDEDEDIDLDEDEDIDLDLDLDLDEYDGISLSGGGDDEDDSKQIYRREKPLKDDKEMFNRLYQYRKLNKENRKFIGDFINAGFDKDDYEYLVRKPSFKGIPVNIFDIFNNKDDIEDVKLAYNLGYTAEELFEKGYKNIGMLYDVFDDPDDESLSRIINKYHYGSRVTRGIPKYLGKFADAITGNFDAFVSTLQKLKEKNTPIQGLLSSGQISKLDESTVDKLLKAGYTVKDLHDYGLTIDQILNVKGFRKDGIAGKMYGKNSGEVIEKNKLIITNIKDESNNDVNILKFGGFSVKEIVDAGVVTKDAAGIKALIGAGYTVKDLIENDLIKKDASGIQQLYESGVTVKDLHESGFTIDDILNLNGFRKLNSPSSSSLEIDIKDFNTKITAGGTTVPITNKSELIQWKLIDSSSSNPLLKLKTMNMLKFAGFTAKEIIEAEVVNKNKLGLDALKNADFNLIKTELKDTGFTAGEMFNAEVVNRNQGGIQELENMGYTVGISDLKDGGFTAKDIVDENVVPKDAAGVAELKNGGFTAKEIVESGVVVPNDKDGIKALIDADLFEKDATTKKIKDVGATITTLASAGVVTNDTVGIKALVEAKVIETDKNGIKELQNLKWIDKSVVAFKKLKDSGFTVQNIVDAELVEKYKDDDFQSMVNNMPHKPYDDDGIKFLHNAGFFAKDLVDSKVVSDNGDGFTALHNAGYTDEEIDKSSDTHVNASNWIMIIRGGSKKSKKKTLKNRRSKKSMNHSMKRK